LSVLNFHLEIEPCEFVTILTPERISQVPEREYHKDTCKREAGYFFVAHPVVALVVVTAAVVVVVVVVI
jgi:hypothetical protein